MIDLRMLIMRERQCKKEMATFEKIAIIRAKTTPHGNQKVGPDDFLR